MLSGLEHIRQSSLLGSLADEELIELVAACQKVSYRGGEVVCKQHEPGESMFVILSGRVRIDVRDASGNCRTLNYLGPGDHFGEMSMLLSSPRAASVVTVIDTELLELSRADFERTLNQVPQFTANLSRSLGSWLSGQISGRRRQPEIMHAAIIRACPAAERLTQQLAETLLAQNCPVSLLSDQACQLPDDLATQSSAKDLPFQKQILQRLSAAVRDKNRVLLDLHPIHATLPLLMQQELIWWVVDAKADNFNDVVAQIQGLLEQAPQLAKRVQLVWTAAAKAELPAANPIRLPVRPPIRILYEGEPHIAQFRTHDVVRIAHAMRGIQLGLALGGGGARGIAHLGVLEVFEREGIYFDRIAGTSAGAIIAVAHAAGISLNDIRTFFEREMTPPAWLRRLPRAKQLYLLAMFRWQLLEKKLRRYLKTYSFDRLTFPAETVSVDLISGEHRVRNSGDIVNAVLESINHPLFGAPIMRDGEALVDGGVLMNVPVAALQQYEVDFTVAVDVGKKLGTNFGGNTPQTTTKGMRRPNYFATLLRVTDVEQKNLSSLHSAQSDVLIAPDTADYPFDDFTQAAGLIDAGRLAAELALPRLKEVLNERFGNVGRLTNTNLSSSSIEVPQRRAA